MDFRFSDESRALQDKLEDFFRAEVLPRNREWHAHVGKHGTAPPFLETLKAEARRRGLVESRPAGSAPDQPGTRLTNLEFAPLAAIMGRLPWAPIVFNCNAPNVPNMEILQKFGTPEQKRQWLAPLLDGKIWTAFGMTEPDVASSDARNIRTRIRKEGGDYVIDGRKWFISGAGHPDCKIVLVVGVTDEEGSSAVRSIRSSSCRTIRRGSRSSGSCRSSDAARISAGRPSWCCAMCACRNPIVSARRARASP